MVPLDAAEPFLGLRQVSERFERFRCEEERPRSLPACPFEALDPLELSEGLRGAALGEEEPRPRDPKRPGELIERQLPFPTLDLRGGFVEALLFEQAIEREAARAA